MSVLCITYNHEPYIGEAVASIVAQETDFEFEVVVRDDASSDRTPEIIREYHQRHPTLIRPVLESTNGYPEVDPVRATLAQCRGEFIAYLEGDDLWLSDHKLQRAVDAFRANPELAAVGHRTMALNPDALTSGPPDGSTIGHPGLFHRETLIACHTSSLVMRAAPLHEFARAFPDNRMFDVALKSILAEAGPGYVLDDVHSAYRVHLGGLWSGMPADEQIEWALRDHRALFECGGSIRVNNEIAYAAWARGGVAQLLRAGHLGRASALWLRSIRHLRRWRSIRFMISPVRRDSWNIRTQ